MQNHTPEGGTSKMERAKSTGRMRKHQASGHDHTYLLYAEASILNVTLLSPTTTTLFILYRNLELLSTALSNHPFLVFLQGER